MRRTVQRLLGPLAAVVGLLLPAAAHAQLKVMMSGGYDAPYRRMLPQFEQDTGLTVTTASGGSQGRGPETIGAQLRNGASADVVILSKEGLADLIAEGRIAPGTAVDLAQTPLGVSVRAGAPKPDISTVAAFRQALLNAKAVAIPGSTSGIYLTTVLFQKLGIADRVKVKLTARGVQSTALVASGEAEMAIQPVSELLPVDGLDFVGPIPGSIQFISVFSAAVVSGTREPAEARRLIAFLASGKADDALRAGGMSPPSNRAPTRP